MTEDTGVVQWPGSLEALWGVQESWAFSEFYLRWLHAQPFLLSSEAPQNEVLPQDSALVCELAAVRAPRSHRREAASEDSYSKPLIVRMGTQRLRESK